MKPNKLLLVFVLTAALSLSLVGRMTERTFAAPHGLTAGDEPSAGLVLSSDTPHGRSFGTDDDSAGHAMVLICMFSHQCLLVYWINADGSHPPGGINLAGIARVRLLFLVA